METTQMLYQRLWNAADILRSKMDANEYKSYLLGLIFYKYLSDNMLMKATELLGEDTKIVKEAQSIYEQYTKESDTEDKEDLKNALEYDFSFSIEPELTYSYLIKQIKEKTFQLESLAQAFRNLEQKDPAFENLFEDIDLYSRKLGQTPQKQNETISQLMLTIDSLDFTNNEKDVLGDAYEYLIGQFASESGKKAGEFYTPQQVSHLMTQIAIKEKENKKGLTVYDPTMGFRVIIMTTADSNDEHWLSSHVL